MTTRINLKAILRAAAAGQRDEADGHRRMARRAPRRGNGGCTAPSGPVRWLSGLWLGLVLAGSVTAVHAAETTTYVLTDVQGTVIMTEDAHGVTTSQQDYRPYGQPNGSVGPDGPGYTGHVNDPGTGLVYMQQRYYDPEVGRFLSVDPIGIVVGGTFSFNRFTYVNSNPILHTDPTGMACGGGGEVSPTVQAMRDTSDSCDGAAVEHVQATSGSSLEQSSPSMVAKPSDYTRTAPAQIVGIVQSPLVAAWEKVVRASHDFNAGPGGKRKEHGVWVYADGSSGLTLVAMPDAKLNPITRMFNSIAAGNPPVIDGYHAVLAIHSHPFELPNQRLLRSGYTQFGSPEPSQWDINYAASHTLPGMVISHKGDFFYGVGQ